MRIFPIFVQRANSPLVPLLRIRRGEVGGYLRIAVLRVGGVTEK